MKHYILNLRFLNRSMSEWIFPKRQKKRRLVYVYVMTLTNIYICKMLISTFSWFYHTIFKVFTTRILCPKCSWMHHFASFWKKNSLRPPHTAFSLSRVGMYVICLAELANCSARCSFLCHIWTYEVFSSGTVDCLTVFSSGTVGCLSVLSFCSLILSLHLSVLLTAFLISFSYWIALIFSPFISFIGCTKWLCLFVCFFLFDLFCIFFVVLFFALLISSSIAMSFFFFFFDFHVPFVSFLLEKKDVYTSFFIFRWIHASLFNTLPKLLKELTSYKNNSTHVHDVVYGHYIFS